MQGVSLEALSACMQSLSRASASISKTSSPLDGQLFEIKHLLILREQMAPFQVSWLKNVTLLFTWWEDYYSYLIFPMNNVSLGCCIWGVWKSFCNSLDQWSLNPVQVDACLHETSLDWSKVRTAALGLVQKRGKLFSLSSNNALLEFIVEGTPQVSVFTIIIIIVVVLYYHLYLFYAPRIHFSHQHKK